MGGGDLTLFVQRVTTRWTQLSRGGAAASVRNRCPVAFPFPERAGWHAVEMREWEDFQVRSSWGADLEDGDRHELLLKETERGFSVRPVPDPSWAPTRERRPPSHVLLPGTWCRWVLNYRTAWESAWEYGLVTYNLAHVERVGDLFLGEPDQLVDERARLR